MTNTALTLMSAMAPPCAGARPSTPRQTTGSAAAYASGDLRGFLPTGPALSSSRSWLQARKTEWSRYRMGRGFRAWTGVSFKV